MIATIEAKTQFLYMTILSLEEPRSPALVRGSSNAVNQVVDPAVVTRKSEGYLHLDELMLSGQKVLAANAPLRISSVTAQTNPIIFC
jgi:hypothetical protein